MWTAGLDMWLLLSIHFIFLAPSALSFPAGISTSTQQKISVSNNELIRDQVVSNDELPTALTDQEALPISDKKLQTEFENGTCYKEFNVSWEFRDISSVVPGECMAGCASQGYFYAAIMGGSICSCGNDQPPQSTIVNSEDCDVKCEGDDSQNCGEANARNFYKLYTVSTFETGKIRTKVRISANDSFYTTDQMVFTDDEEREGLLAPTHLLKSGFLNGSCYSVSNVTWEVRDISTVVPEECMAGCASQGYFYAAIMGGSLCSCGNDQPPQSTIVNSEDCDVKCEGDDTQNCGGANARNFYKLYTVSTFETGKIRTKVRISANDSFYTTDQMVFTDDEEREGLLAPTHLLKSGFLNGSCYSVSNVSWEVRDISSVVPSECMAECASQGYFYAAIMGGSLCSCGNDQPPQSTVVNSQDCDVKCEGDETRNCGGSDKMKVFEMFTGSTFESNDSKIKIRIGIATRIKFNDGRFYIKD